MKARFLPEARGLAALLATGLLATTPSPAPAQAQPAGPAPAAAPARAAAPGVLAAETVLVKEVPAPLPSDPAAALWDSLPATTMVAAPQVTIRLNDRKANEALAKAANRPVRVRAATDGEALAVVVEWPDATESRATPDETDVYGDAAALQLPLRFGAGVRLPYVGMGDDEQPVAVYLQRAAPQGAVSRQAVGSGFGTLQRKDLGGVRVGMRYDAGARAWRALFLRPLAAGGHDLRRGLVPFSVAVWDGAGLERGGNKALGGWKLLRLERYPVDPTYQAELSWGHAPGDLGDPRRGQELFEGACTVCHTAGAQRAAPGLAPDLSAIGAIATPGYLRDSILAPSAVIVPSPNPAQHQDRSGKPGPTGAWPADEGYVWHQLGPDGKKTSTMPEYASMPKEDVGAIVAYLMTLGAEPPGAGSKP